MYNLEDFALIIIILCNKEQTKVLDLCKIFFVCADVFICLTLEATVLNCCWKQAKQMRNVCFRKCCTCKKNECVVKVKLPISKDVFLCLTNYLTQRTLQ